ncbi:MAG TPA: hypothetical protein VFC02_06390 [Anaerolineales bacterium]|nr:hypothetical protein [Anaerolineales bacterium]
MTSITALQSTIGTAAFCGAVTTAALYFLVGKDPMSAATLGGLSAGAFYVTSMATGGVAAGDTPWQTGITWDYSQSGMASPGRLMRLAVTAAVPVAYEYFVNNNTSMMNLAQVAGSAAAGPLAAGAFVYASPGNF